MERYCLQTKPHQGTVTLEVGEKIKYLKTIAQSEIVTNEDQTHELLMTVCFQDISDYVKKKKLEEEIKNYNKMNYSMRIRNKLIRKIFGCFVLRQQDERVSWYSNNTNVAQVVVLI